MRIANHLIERVPIDSIKPHPANPREGDVGAVIDSLQEHGFFGVCVCQLSTRFILAGNHRWRAAKYAEATEIDVAWIDCDDDEALRILLVDNRTSDLATYDMERLTGLLTGLYETSRGLAGTGYDNDALDELIRDLGHTPPLPPEDDPDAISRADELRAKYNVAAGQVWTAGRHRIACGDSTDGDMFVRLMGDDTAACVWTDPPYGVEYEGKTKDKLRLQNDEGAGLPGLLDAAFANTALHVEPGAPFYVASPSGPMSVEFTAAIVRGGWRFHQQLVWVKNAMVLGYSDYHSQHESILYGWLPGHGRSGRGDHKGSRWYGGNDQTSVFHVDRPSRSELHPTMKPPDLIVPMLRNSLPADGIVIDSFAGSGSTLIAAQISGRSGRGIELDPRFVAVTLERLSSMGLTLNRID